MTHSKTYIFCALALALMALITLSNSARTSLDTKECLQGIKEGLVDVKELTSTCSGELLEQTKEGLELLLEDVKTKLKEMASAPGKVVEKTKEGLGKLSESAKETVQDAKREGTEFKDQVKEGFEKVSEDAKERFRKMTGLDERERSIPDELFGKAKEQFYEAKDSLAKEGLEKLAEDVKEHLKEMPGITAFLYALKLVGTQAYLFAFILGSVLFALGIFATVVAYVSSPYIRESMIRLSDRMNGIKTRVREEFEIHRRGPKGASKVE